MCRGLRRGGRGSDRECVYQLRHSIGGAGREFDGRAGWVSSRANQENRQPVRSFLSRRSYESWKDQVRGGAVEDTAEAGVVV